MTYEYVCKCVITGKTFYNKDSENIAETHIGSVWVGLWEDEPFVFDEFDFVLLPRKFIPWLKALGKEILPNVFVPENASFYIR